MLTAGTHKLTRFENDSEDHCILVKLTDTSAKYIQEFIRNQDENRKTSIKFSQDNGEIIFSNTNQKKQTKSFQFAISNIKGPSTNRSSINGSNKDGTTSFECASYKSKIFTSVSHIEEKITVKATDEAFQATKEKVISVAEEEKKNSAIEIKPSTLNLRISRNVTSITKPLKRLQQKSPVKISTSLNNLNVQKLRETNSFVRSSKIQTKPYFNNNHSSSFDHKRIENNPGSSTVFKKCSTHLKSNENVFQAASIQAKKQNPPIFTLKPNTNNEIIKPRVVEMIKPVQPVQSFWDSPESLSEEPMTIDDLLNNKTNNQNMKLFEKETKNIIEDDWLNLKKINSLEDRKKLHEICDKLFPEYFRLHCYFTKENKILCFLQEQIELMNENSPEYQQFSSRMIEECEKKKSNPVYSSNNQLYKPLLCTKLAHFYNLIKDFDAHSCKMNI